MDFIDDLAWMADATLYQRHIGQLREQLQRTQNERDLANWDLRKARELTEENLELKLRLSILIRLLITKSVITAQEYASMIAEARQKS
jgi:hypothetical protein